MGLFDHFPYTNVHELNLDWVLRMMKALEAAWEQFTAGNSLTFADPLQHDISRTYAKNTIVLDANGNAYVSLQAVPVGVGLQNGDYWLMVFDYEAFIEKVNKNFTARYYRGSYRATAAMAIGDWLTVDDVLCKATAAIAADDVLEIGVNIEHFTLEDFIKAFMTSANQTIQQYKNDIDASELAYRNQLAQDIANTTANLQAQLNAAISGVTVDSEVINARISADSITYPTLGDSIRTVTSIPRLYPFDVPIGTVLRHPSTSSVVYDTKKAGIKKLTIKAMTPAAYKDYYLINLFAYHSGLYLSQFTVRSSDNAITFNYTSAVRPDPANLPTEDLTLTASDGSVLTCTIDWAIINTNTGGNIPNGSNGFKIDSSCIEIIPNADISRLYPFTEPLNAILRHPSTNSVVYNAALSGIKKIHIETSANDDFYVLNLYSYHLSLHTSLVTIRNADNSVTFNYQSAARPDPSNLPTETLNLTATDGSKCDITIDWAKINTNTGVNIPNGSEAFRISEECVTRIDGYCNFDPVTDYYVTDEQQRIYLNELAQYDKTGFFIIQVSGATSPEVITGWNGETQYIEFNVTATKDIIITLRYRKQAGDIATKTITVHAVVGVTMPAKKYIFIGDSLTAAGVYLKQFEDLNSGTVTLYGTKETLGVHHEGRSGWSANNYVNDATHGGVTNPFYNPITQTFDFSYYITNNPSFSDVDCVVIFLGRNDGYTSGVITNLDAMINSILSYNSSIKCYVIGAYNVPDNNSGLGKTLQSCYTLNLGAHNYNRNNFYPHYTSNPDAAPIPVSLNLDNKYDYATGSQVISNVDPRTMEVYTDTIHPSSIGYKKFGYVLNSFFRYILNL